jgi:hypothetical protein
MKNPLNVVIVPEPNNQGEDLNWIGYLILGHEDKNQLERDVLNKIFAEFFKLPINDEEHDDWEDLDSTERQVLLSDLMDEKGYTVFPLTHGIMWCC